MLCKNDETPEPGMMEKGQLIQMVPIHLLLGIFSADNELRPYVCKAVSSLQSMSVNYHFILITITGGGQSRTHYSHFTAGDH